jgi:hypothetical protein
MARRASKRGLLSIARSKPRRVYQDVEAIDQFGERAERKREAAKTARELGHDLGPWHKRPNDSAGRVNAFCVTCNRPAVVFTADPLEGFPATYGKALTEPCERRQ